VLFVPASDASIAVLRGSWERMSGSVLIHFLQEVIRVFWMIISAGFEISSALQKFEVLKKARLARLLLLGV
jgi:hypothetical protein